MKKLIQFEMRKIFSTRLTQTALIVLLVLTGLLTCSTYLNKYAFDGVSQEGTGKRAVEIDKAIAARYEGILTDEKVRQMMADFAPKVDLHGMNAVYLYQNALQSAIFARFSDTNGNWNGLSVSDVFGEEEIRVGYIDGWLTTSMYMVQIIMVLSLVIMVMLAPVFAGEYSGVDNIILTSKYGRTKCAVAKVLGSIFAVLLVTAVVLVMNVVFALLLYGSSGLNCSILLASVDYIEGYIPFNITCGVLLKYQILLAFTNAVSITGITLVLSSVCKNPMVALIASAAINFLPIMLPFTETNPLFRYITLLPLYHVQFISLMSVEQMGNGMLYAIFAIPVAVVTIVIGAVVSHRVFGKHQVV